MRLLPAWAALLGAAFVLQACGKQESPKVDAATEQAQARERAKQDVFGTQVKAIDTAKGVQDNLNQQVQQNVDSIEKNAK